MQASRPTNEHLAERSSEMHNSEMDDRGRRRIAPTQYSTPHPVRIASVEPAGPSFTVDVTPTAEAESWNYLVKWEAADDTILGDIDEEEEEYYSDVSDEPPDGMEDADVDSNEGDDLPSESLAAKPSKLGTAKVVEIINDCIEKYAKAWSPGKGETRHKYETGRMEVPVTYDVVAMWEEAEATGQREDYAEKYGLEAEYYRQRLDNLCEEIIKDAGDTIAGVQTKCRNLEVTVELLERATWLEEIYKLAPEASSDDEAQAGDLSPAQRVSPSPTQPPENPSRQDILSRVIDLSTSSAPSDAGDDDTPLGDQPRTSIHTNQSNDPKNTAQARTVTSTVNVIDSIETAINGTVTIASPSRRSRALLGDAPEEASLLTVSRWSWAQLEETQDRKRVVTKAISEMSSINRERIRQRLQRVGRAHMEREIPACIDMFLRGDNKLPGILPQDLPKIITFTRLFLCWWFCGNYFQKEPSKPALVDLANCLRQHLSDPTTFCDYVAVIFSTTFSHYSLNSPSRPSQAEVIEISDDE